MPGVTTGFDVNSLLVQGGGSICASLDVQGAPFLVFGPIICNFFGSSNSTIVPPLPATITEEHVRLAENSGDNVLLFDNLYPVPATDELNIRYIAAGVTQTQIRIQSMDGRILFSERYIDTEGLNNRILNTRQLSTGTYLISLENDQQVQTRKFEIIR